MLELVKLKDISSCEGPRTELRLTDRLAGSGRRIQVAFDEATCAPPRAVVSFSGWIANGNCGVADRCLAPLFERSALLISSQQQTRGLGASWPSSTFHKR